MGSLFFGAFGALKFYKDVDADNNALQNCPHLLPKLTTETLCRSTTG